MWVVNPSARCGPGRRTSARLFTLTILAGRGPGLWSMQSPQRRGSRRHPGGHYSDFPEVACGSPGKPLPVGRTRALADGACPGDVAVARRVERHEEALVLAIVGSGLDQREARPVG